jgi:hypothetical protein
MAFRVRKMNPGRRLRPPYNRNPSSEAKTARSQNRFIVQQSAVELQVEIKRRLAELVANPHPKAEKTIKNRNIPNYALLDFNLDRRTFNPELLWTGVEKLRDLLVEIIV